MAHQQHHHHPPVTPPQQSQHHHGVREALVAICLRLARDDPTVPQLILQSQPVWHWKDEDFLLLGKSLMSNHHLQFLQLDMHPNHQYRKVVMSSRAAKAFRQGIAQSKLRVLHSEHTPSALQKIFVEALQASETLRNFNILKATFTETRSLSKWLRTPRADGISSSSGCPLLHLGLQKCALTNIDMLTLSLGLADNCTLTSLYLEDNKIRNVGVLYFLSHWHPKSPLERLRLALNPICATGAAALCRAIGGEHHPALQILSLLGNHLIGHDGLIMIGELLPQLHLVDLDISSICMGIYSPPTAEVSYQASLALANGLRGNTTLTKLDVGGNHLSARGAQVLLQAVAAHPTLRHLNLKNDVSIGLVGLQYIAQELPHTHLESIVLSNVVDPWPKTKRARETAQSLVEGVRNTRTLTKCTMEELPSMWMETINFWTGVNQTCRPLWSSTPLIATSVWPRIFDKWGDNGQVGFLYLSLREQPWLVVMPSRNMPSKKKNRKGKT